VVAEANFFVTGVESGTDRTIQILVHAHVSRFREMKSFSLLLE
jgi:hypothetical protein